MADQRTGNPGESLADEPFSFRETRNAGVQISCRGRIVKTLRGAEAAKFVSKARSTERHGLQLLMARVTGQFKFGNERAAKHHTRRGSS